MKQGFIKRKIYKTALFLLTATMAVSQPAEAAAINKNFAHEKTIAQTEYNSEVVAVGLRSGLKRFKAEITKDRSAPKITGLPDSFTIKQSKKSKKEPEKKPTKPDYLDGVTAKDKQDGDVTFSLRVDDTDVDYFEVGEYFVKVTASDSSGNEATEDIPVSITDGKAPSIKIEGKALSAKKEG